MQYGGNKRGRLNGKGMRKSMKVGLRFGNRFDIIIVKIIHS